ncbi:MAG: right-handed parallel beta-helix repeat-containing protein [Candidatus Bathyarchaeota archaeon]|nr:right-handed parallel beta-helix repeat-containing protein [Candidatus Bathyarchaeota archaeon]
MQKLACAALILLMVFSGLFFVVPVQGETHKSGLLTSDATWTAAESPIALTGPVGVKNGVTLTIEPGVTVKLAGFYIQVNGTLIAKGTSDKSIFFESPPTYLLNGAQLEFTSSSSAWVEQAGSGCLIENAHFVNVSVSVTGGSPKITSCVFQYTGSFSSGSIFVTAGAPIVTKNTITCGRNQNGINAAGDGYFANNKITDCWIGVTATGQATLEGNVIENCVLAGISSDPDSFSSSVTIKHNYIANNKFWGIQGGGDIEYNTIINNQVGIRDPLSSTVISHNNIVNNRDLNNTVHSLYLKGPYNIDAANNWWGTTDTQLINQTIYDSQDDYNLGTVNYDPILTAPENDAPSSDNLDLNNIAPLPTSPPVATEMPQATQLPQNQTSQPNSSTPLGDQSSNQATPSFDFIGVIVVVVVVLAVVTVAFSVFRVYRRVDKTAE